MFSIRSAFGQPRSRPAQRTHEPAGTGRFRSSQDFSVRAYQRLDAIRSRAFLPDGVRALGRSGARLLRRVLEAMHESRREQAMAMLERYGHLIDASGQAAWSAPQNVARAREVGGMPYQTGSPIGPAIYGMRIRCSITGSPCDGDHAHVCLEWGCARKGGLSPVSHENA